MGIHLQKRPTHHHHTDFWLDLHMTDWFWNWKCAQQHRHIICKIVSSYYTEHSLFNLVFLEWCFWIIFTAYLRIHLSFWIQWINKMILSSLMESLETSFSLANFICIVYFYIPFTNTTWLPITSFPLFVSAKYHLIIVKLKSIWQWMKKSIIIIFSFKILKIFKIKSQTTKNTILEKLFITFFSQKKNSYFLTITNSIHKIYTWFAFWHFAFFIFHPSCRLMFERLNFDFDFFLCVCLRNSKQVWIEKKWE